MRDERAAWKEPTWQSPHQSEAPEVPYVNVHSEADITARKLIKVPVIPGPGEPFPDKSTWSSAVRGRSSTTTGSGSAGSGSAGSGATGAAAGVWVTGAAPLTDSKSGKIGYRGAGVTIQDAPPAPKNILPPTPKRYAAPERVVTLNAVAEDSDGLGDIDVLSDPTWDGKTSPRTHKANKARAAASCAPEAKAAASRAPEASAARRVKPPPPRYESPPGFRKAPPPALVRAEDTTASKRPSPATVQPQPKRHASQVLFEQRVREEQDRAAQRRSQLVDVRRFGEDDGGTGSNQITGGAYTIVVDETRLWDRGAAHRVTAEPLPAARAVPKAVPVKHPPAALLGKAAAQSGDRRQVGQEQAAAKARHKGVSALPAPPIPVRNLTALPNPRISLEQRSGAILDNISRAEFWLRGPRCSHLVSIDMHNVLDSRGRGSQWDRGHRNLVDEWWRKKVAGVSSGEESFREPVRDIPPVYTPILAELARHGWRLHVISFVHGRDREGEVRAKIDKLNEVMQERFGNDPLVARSLPIGLSICYSKTDYQTGKPAQHIAAARRLGVFEGVHIDDSPEICDAFATLWRDEARIFRVQYRRPRAGDAGTHRDQRIVFQSGEQALKAILAYRNIRELCAQRV